MLNDVADEVLSVLRDRGDMPLGSALEALRLVLGGERLERLLRVPDASIAWPKNQRGGAGTREIEVDFMGVLTDWVAGVDVQLLADRHLSEIRDPEFRLEELADLTTSAFDNFLPWALGIVQEWVNQAVLEDERALPALPESLPAFVRYGVASDDAVTLIRAGVTSRSLATKVATAFADDADRGDLSLRGWLCTVDFAVWRERFDATPLDLRLLLEFARPRGTQLAARLLNGEAVTFPVRPVGEPQPRSEVVLRSLPDEFGPPRVGFWFADELLATVLPDHQTEIDAVRATGIPLRISLVPASSGLAAQIELESSVTQLGDAAPNDTLDG
jgi:hypothetical protein